MICVISCMISPHRDSANLGSKKVPEAIFCICCCAENKSCMAKSIKVVYCAHLRYFAVIPFSSVSRMSDPKFYAEAALHIARQDPDFASLIAQVGPCLLSPKVERNPYEALLRAIAYQQLNGKAAEAILGRFLALYPDGFPSPQQIQATADEVIRGCGFSASKLLAIRSLAENTLAGVVPSREEAQMLSDEELIKRLVTLRGIGRWTVEMLLIFNLQRMDVLPVDDFGVREGWKLLKGLPEQPKPKVLAEIGEAWQPYRSVATWYLWRAVDCFKNKDKK